MSKFTWLAKGICVELQLKEFWGSFYAERENLCDQLHIFKCDLICIKQETLWFERLHRITNYLGKKGQNLKSTKWWAGFPCKVKEDYIKNMFFFTTTETSPESSLKLGVLFSEINGIGKVKYYTSYAWIFLPSFTKWI